MTPGEVVGLTRKKVDRERKQYTGTADDEGPLVLPGPDTLPRRHDQGKDHEPDKNSRPYRRGVFRFFCARASAIFLFGQRDRLRPHFSGIDFCLLGDRFVPTFS